LGAGGVGFRDVPRQYQSGVYTHGRAYRYCLVYFSSMAESMHAFSKPNGKLELYYLFYSFPNRRSTRLPNETGFIYDSIGTLDSLCYLSYMSKNLCLYMISIYFYICLIYGSVSKGNLLTEISGEGFFFYLIWCFGDSYFPSCPFFLFN
jgi:hypothetical protein